MILSALSEEKYGSDMKVMSVINLEPRKLGSFEEYTLQLSQYLTQQGGQSILVFNEFPPESLQPYYTNVGAVLETKPFEAFGSNSACALNTLLRKYQPDVVHLHFVNMLSLDVLVASMHRGVKVVFTEHTSDIPKQGTVLKSRLLQTSKLVFSSRIDQV